MRTRLLALCLMAAAALVSAQASQFVLSSRDRAQLIAINFAVTTADGTALDHLTPSDVTVRLGGRAREVLAVDYVRTPLPGTTGQPPAPYGDNAEPGVPRSMILMVDEDTIRPGRTVTVRDAIRQLLAGLGPGDRVALVTVPFGGLAVDLTTNQSRIIDAVNQLVAQGARAETTADAQCRTLNTLGMISDALRRLSVVEDPVSVVFFSSHQEGPQSVIRMTGSAPVGGPCDLRATTFTDLGAAVAQARARFFVVHADLDQRGRGLDGLEHIAGVTGGPLLFLATRDGRPAIERVLSDTSGHFVARVARLPDDRPGDRLPVSVQVSRPHTTVWRSPEFVVTRPPSATAPPGPVSVLDLMRDARLTRDLPLRVSGRSFPDTVADRVRVAVAMESPAPGASLAGAMVGAFDESGELVAGLEMSADALVTQPVVAALSLPPGRYRLRAAATDSAGRGGTVDTLLDAGLTTIGPLVVSDMLIGLSRNGRYVPVFEFADEPTAFVMLEVHGAGALPNRVTVEIAGTINGPALKTMRGLVEPTDTGTRAVVTAVVPLADLPAGDYAVRVTLTPEGHPSGRILGTLRKIAR